MVMCVKVSTDAAPASMQVPPSTRVVQYGASELAGGHAALHEEVVNAVYLCAHERGRWQGGARPRAVSVATLLRASAHLVLREELASEVERSCQLRKTRAATSWRAFRRC